MESTEKLQQDELTALQSIYAEDFVIQTKQTAWKVRLEIYLLLRIR